MSGGYGEGLYGEGVYGGALGVPFLAAQLGSGARLLVEAAWGADLAADSATWTWTDITEDVRQSDGAGIELTHGRADEATVMQPATCKLLLDNSSGDYSLGGQSSLYPYVRQNTPIRVRVDHDGNGTYNTLFQGYADSWTPTWEMNGASPAVALSASGVLRRLAQNTAPVLSSLRRRLTTESNVRAYWPCEDGREATAAASAFDGHPSMLWTVGTPNFAAASDAFDCSLPLPTLTDSALDGFVLPYTHTGEWQVRMLMVVPDTGMSTNGNLLRVYTSSSSIAIVEIDYGSGGGSMSLTAYDASGTSVYTSGVIGFAINGQSGRLFLSMDQDGADVDYRYGWQPIGGTATFWDATITGRTIGAVTRVIAGYDFDHDDWTVGHVVVQDEVTDIHADDDELEAFAGEVTTFAVDSGRFGRLCAENGIENIAYGDSTSFDQPTDVMGPQRPDVLLNLLRDAERVDQGIIVDGLTAGLVFRTRRNLENRDADLTVDISAKELAQPLQPVCDDQGRVNRAIVNRQDGVTAEVADEDGPLGTDTIGIYDTSMTVPVESDEAPRLYAGWLVHKGTVEGYRYPTLALDLAATPDLIPAWLTATDVGPGERIDITNPAAAATGHADATISQQIQGFRQFLTPYRWDVEMNCAPFEPWRIGVVAAESGDTDEFLARLDSGGSTLAAGAAAGATSLSVATTSGLPLWTTTADDLPFEIEVAGIAITVTAISGSSSPQTFTVTGSTVTKALSAGAEVKVHRPPALGL